MGSQADEKALQPLPQLLLGAQEGSQPDFLRLLAGVGPMLAPAEGTRPDMKVSPRQQTQLVCPVAHSVPQ